MIEYDGKNYNIEEKKKSIYETSDGYEYSDIVMAIDHEKYLEMKKDINKFYDSIEIKSVTREDYKYLVNAFALKMMDTGYKILYIESEEIYDKFAKIETEIDFQKGMLKDTMLPVKFDYAKDTIQEYPTFLAYNKTHRDIITKDQFLERMRVNENFINLCNKDMEERKNDTK